MYAIGVDISGEFIKYALVSNKGIIKDSNEFSIIKNDPRKSLTLLAKGILEMIKKNNISIKGIGVGISGILENGKLVSSSNLKSFVGLNIASILEKKTHIKTKISNNGNTITLGETMFGAAKDQNNVILITLDNAISGGLIINGKLYEGNKGQGAELGHMVITLNGKACGCGRRGCFEAYASSIALTNQTIAEMNSNKKSYMWNLAKFDINNVDASLAFKAEKFNDRSAKRVIEQYIMYLSEGILNYCNIFRPDVVILSNGVAKQKSNLINRVNKYLSEHEYGIKGTAKVRVVNGKLGYDSNVIGAASLIFNK